MTAPSLAAVPEAPAAGRVPAALAWLRRALRLRTIHARLVVGFTSCLLLLGASGVTAYVLLLRTNAHSREAVTLLRDEYDVVQRTVTTILREIVAGTRLLNTNTEDDQARYAELMDAADALRREAITLPILSPEERRELERIGEMQSRLEVGLAVSRAYAATGRAADATRVLQRTATDVEGIERALERLRATAATRAAEREAQMAAELDLGELLLLSFLVLALPVAGFFGITTSRAVTRPLERFGGEMTLIGAGDLRVPERDRGWYGGSAEYHRLAAALDEARDRLRELLGEVQREADHVSAASAELAASAGGAADSTQHVTSAVTEMAEGAAAQLDALTQASDAVRQLAEDGAAIGEAAQESERAGQDIHATAATTREGIGRAVTTLLAARETADASAREIGALREATASIDRFVAVIAEIASQTNLLALNAAIEAARAGAAGRGFAVVAEEVRRLADQSADAADEVAASVRAITARVASATAAAETGAARLQDVQAVAGGASTALQEIELAVGRVQSASRRVAAAVDASRRQIHTVEEAIVTARDAAQNHAASAEEVAASTQETSASAEEVSATAELLRTAAGRIRGLVGGFRV
ncbi:MAG TPA: methyl-accepting chemotaxis protein [Gemmatimonadaceae bacterium]|nr:methyl-accepting chemotaxis protein [Gemmatimonadaceae bacterium]